MSFPIVAIVAAIAITWLFGLLRRATGDDPEREREAVREARERIERIERDG